MVVGVLAKAEDEYADHVRVHFAVIGELLDRAGAGQWAEPELNERDVLEADMWGYSGLHTVRRVAVHLAETGTRPSWLDLALAWRALCGYEGALRPWQDQHRISPAAGSGREHAVRRARPAAMAAVAREGETWS